MPAPRPQVRVARRACIWVPWFLRIVCRYPGTRSASSYRVPFTFVPADRVPVLRHRVRMFGGMASGAGEQTQRRYDQLRIELGARLGLDLGGQVCRGDCLSGIGRVQPVVRSIGDGDDSRPKGDA